jgi:hypothetical protein
MSGNRTEGVTFRRILCLSLALGMRKRGHPLGNGAFPVKVGVCWVCYGRPLASGVQYVRRPRVWVSLSFNLLLAT